MKLLYINPNINEEGGVQKVLSVKLNYFIEYYDYKVDILTQNNGFENSFFDFNSQIGLYDMTLKGNKLTQMLDYKKQVLKHIKLLQPNIIIVCDFGIKACLIPLLIHTKIPIIFEAHGSLYNEPNYFSKSIKSNLLKNIKYAFRKFTSKKFDYFVALSQESLKEWNNKNGLVIPNAINNLENKIALLTSKKMIAISRHSYEKGLDRLLKIWKIVSQKHPDWQLDIYGKQVENNTIINLAKNLEVEKSINFYDPIKNINEKYLDASICVMTSRTEGFGLVLLEAMSFGLPVIAYDCPVGPGAIIENNKNGFLIEDGNETEFVNAICNLIENQDLRLEMGKNAKISSENYNLAVVMQNWDELFKEIIVS